MSEETYEKYFEAGKIAKEIKRIIPSLVKPGAKVIGICETIENKIRSKGAKPAFPVNISINHVAAHYTSPPGDKTVIRDGDIVKVDFGVHIDGCIVDTALTIDLSGEHTLMVQAAESALEAAFRLLRDGVNTKDIGFTIYKVITTSGFKPISNLVGHLIKRYRLHAGIEIPNVPVHFGKKLKSGFIVAIEPFVTTPSSVGRVKESKEVYIFSILRTYSRSQEIKSILDFISEKFSLLPFCERWLLSKFSSSSHAIIEKLLSSKYIRGYNVLVEATGGVVTQAEDTFLITEDSAINLTGV